MSADRSRRGSRIDRRIVNREAESFPFKNLIHALHGFGDGITADA
ncbi:hypothetical protein HMPREF1315_1102 [Bifidobacterium longum subsp. longum 2-2B]|uniref:Uncharacterized protein n=1 Tax=Bifidobacterium longum subsp. longum 2-2B TaxID=1161745 RepID=A0AAV3FJT7_BIFLL|nr:hypothetical protein HMPREF1315_1102 [Bifidobacterium longum subsp. longum 2-2B]